MFNVIIAIDSFKHCLTSQEAAAAVAQGIREVQPAAEVLELPVSDGGEGMLTAFLAALHGERITVPVHDPLMRPIQASFGISADGTTAIIEMAEASGLQLLKPEERNPMVTTTYGTGELILAALERGCRRFIIGLGGSATCDGGVGMLQALGMKFYDKTGSPLLVNAAEPQTLLTHLKARFLNVKPLQRLSQIYEVNVAGMHPALRECRFTLASDVTNPLCGPNGAAYVFGPQKGATQQMVYDLDGDLLRLAVITGHKTEANHPGAGAAGGLGFAFLAFLDAQMQSGIELLLELLHFDQLLQGSCSPVSSAKTGADNTLVITGEGSADRQTLMGKLPVGILHHARQAHIPVWLLAGKVSDRQDLLHAGFAKVECINPPHLPLDEAIKPTVAKKNLADTVVRLLGELTS